MIAPDPSVIAGRLRPLGFKRYDEYLASAHWMATRRAALARAHGRCEARGCISRHRLQVHHLTYARLGHERHADLMVLCSSCHANAHDQARPKVVKVATTSPQAAHLARTKAQLRREARAYNAKQARKAAARKAATPTEAELNAFLDRCASYAFETKRL